MLVYLLDCGGRGSLGTHACSECRRPFPPADWPPADYLKYNVGKEFVAHVEQAHKPEDGFEFRVPELNKPIKFQPDDPARYHLSAGEMGVFSVWKKDDINKTVCLYSRALDRHYQWNERWAFLSYPPEEPREQLLVAAV